MSRINYSYLFPYVEPTGQYDSIMISYAGWSYSVAAEIVYDLDKCRIRRFSDTMVYSCTGTDVDIARVDKWVENYRNRGVPPGEDTVDGLAKALFHDLFTVHPIGDREVVITGLDYHKHGCVQVYGPHRYFKTKDYHLGGMHAFEFLNMRKRFSEIRRPNAFLTSDEFAFPFIQKFYRSMHENKLLLGNLIRYNKISASGIDLVVDDLRTPIRRAVVPF